MPLMSNLERLDPERERHRRLAALDDLKRMVERSPYARTADAAGVVRGSRDGRARQLIDAERTPAKRTSRRVTRGVVVRAEIVRMPLHSGVRWGRWPTERPAESKEGREMARAMDCACGEVLQADNDALLIQQIRQHVDQAHPDAGYTDGQIQQMAEQNAYDVRDTDA